MDPRAFAIGVAVVALGATLSPLVRAPADDGFPLSTYPMFASKRDRELRIAYPLGVTRTGERRVLWPGAVGTHEVIQAIGIVKDAVERKEVRELCARIAERMRGTDIVTVRIVVGTHDALDLVEHGTLGQEHERTRCPVPR